MKTIEEIINNESYERLNGALVDRVIEIMAFGYDIKTTLIITM